MSTPASPMSQARPAAPAGPAEQNLAQQLASRGYQLPAMPQAQQQRPAGAFDGGGGDLPIYAGWRQQRTDIRFGNEAVRPPTGAITTTVSVERARLFQMAPEERTRVQQAMFIGGYYGNREPSSIQWGEPDDVTEAAWNSVLIRAAKEAAAGNRVTVNQLLSRMAAGPMLGNPEEAGGGSRGSGGGGGSTASVISPQSATELANNVSSTLLGRRASVEEQRLIHAAIREAQIKFQQARGGEIPAPEAMAAEMLRDRNPNEAAGQDLAGAYGMFVQMLDGIGV